jgi:hypothetical protein
MRGGGGEGGDGRGRWREKEERVKRGSSRRSREVSQSSTDLAHECFLIIFSDIHRSNINPHIFDCDLMSFPSRYSQYVLEPHTNYYDNHSL